jgi:hypothetical protein
MPGFSLALGRGFTSSNTAARLTGGNWCYTSRVSKQMSFIRKWTTDNVEIRLETVQRILSPNIEAAKEGRKTAQGAATHVNH